MPADAYVDACPQCGDRMQPVLDTATAGTPRPGPLLHDSPVRLQCLGCSPDRT